MSQTNKHAIHLLGCMLGIKYSYNIEQYHIYEWNVHITNESTMYQGRYFRSDCNFSV